MNCLARGIATVAFACILTPMAEAQPTSTPLAPGQPDPADESDPPNAPEAPDQTATPAPTALQCIPACRDGYLCHRGQCISACNPPCQAGELCTGTGTCQPDQPSPAVTPAPAVSSAGAPLDAQFSGEEAEIPGGANLHVNVLGLLQFGLIPRAEFGGSTTFLLGAHFFNTGALSHVVIPGDDAYLNFSVGGNLGVRHYFDARGAQAGAYLGAFLEYAFVTTTDDSDDMAQYHRELVIPAAEGGYRWVWGSFLLDVGGTLGAAFPVVVEDTPIDSSGLEDSSVGCVYEDSCLEESETTAFGMGMLNIGFFL